MKNRVLVRGRDATIFANGQKGEELRVRVDRKALPRLRRVINASIRCSTEGTRQVPCVIYRVKEGGVWVWRRLSRLITKAPRTKMVDHKNHNPLDNRSRNLRLVNHSQNGQNRAKSHGVKTVSGHRNVHWSPRHKQWVVRLKIKGVLKFFGYHRLLGQAVSVATKARRIHMPFHVEAS